MPKWSLQTQLSYLYHLHMPARSHTRTDFHTMHTPSAVQELFKARQCQFCFAPAPLSWLAGHCGQGIPVPSCRAEREQRCCQRAPSGLGKQNLSLSCTASCPSHDADSYSLSLRPAQDPLEQSLLLSTHCFYCSLLPSHQPGCPWG